MAEKFLTFCQNYGFVGLLVVVLSIVITFFVKQPIKAFAKKWAMMNSESQTTITQWIPAIPLLICFIGGLLVEWGHEGWGTALFKNTFDWTNTMLFTLGTWSFSISVNDVGGLFLKTMTSKSIKKNADGRDAKVLEATTAMAASALTESDKAKLAEQVAKEQAKKAKEEARLQAQMAELNKKMASLQTAKDQLTATATATATSDQPRVL